MEPMNPDSESVYDAEIAPLMAKILEICKASRIPMVASFQYAAEDDAGESKFCTSRIPFGGESPSLAAALVEIRREPSFMAMTITTR
jgi:hypothetical protein